MTEDTRTCAQVPERDLEKREEINSSQQHHNIDSSNGEMLDCDTNEAHTLVDAMCEMNKTFRTKENFMNPWWKS